MNPRTSTSVVTVGRTREKGGVEDGRVKPDTAEGVDLEALAISFVGEVCARTATFGEKVDEAVDVGGAGRRGWWLSVTGCAPLDRIRV